MDAKRLVDDCLEVWKTLGSIECRDRVVFVAEGVVELALELVLCFRIFGEVVGDSA